MASQRKNYGAEMPHRSDANEIKIVRKNFKKCSDMWAEHQEVKGKMLTTFGERGAKMRRID